MYNYTLRRKSFPVANLSERQPQITERRRARIICLERRWLAREMIFATVNKNSYFLLIIMSFLFITSIVLFSLGAISGFFFRRDPKTAQVMSLSFAIAASSIGVVFALSALASSAPFEISFSSVFSAPLFSFFVDRLSAFFILLTSAAGVIVSIFALGYLAHGKYSGTRTALMGFLYNLFLCSMILVAGADNIITFLVVSVLMPIFSYFLSLMSTRKAKI